MNRNSSGTEPNERGAVLEQELRRYVRELSQEPDTVGIVVFGSLGGGMLHEDSDIDLMVVKETRVPFLERLRWMRRALQPKVATDFLVYTPEEVAHLWRSRPFFRVEIMGRGKVLYERERGTLAQLCA